YSWGGVSSLGDLFALIARQSYGAGHLVAPPFRGGSSLHRILALFVTFGAMLTLFAGLGVARAFRQCRWYFWFGLLGFGCAGPLFAIISNINLAASPQTLF